MFDVIICPAGPMQELSDVRLARNMSSLDLGQVKLVLEPCSAAGPVGVNMAPGPMGDRRGNLLGKDDCQP